MWPPEGVFYHICMAKLVYGLSRCNISLRGRILDFSTNNIGGCDNIQYRPCRADIFPYTPSQQISRGVILLVLKSNIRPLRGVVYWISVLTLSHLSCKIRRPPVTKQYRPAYIIMKVTLFSTRIIYQKRK